MKFEKRISEDGDIRIFVDDVSMDGGMQITRDLTGVTNSSHPLFNIKEDKQTFWYGSFKKSWFASNNSNEDSFGIIRIEDKIEEIARIIMLRITLIRAWVAECKASGGSVEILEPEEVLERLQSENRLLYRNKAGQINVLDI